MDNGSTFENLIDNMAMNQPSSCKLDPLWAQQMKLQKKENNKKK